jgi:putative DNA primase/helicase
VITHPSKNAGSKAINHYIGSQAFVAAARIGHLCVEELEEEEDDEGKVKKVPTGRILFANAKNNASRKMPTLAYRVVGDICIGQDPKTGNNITAARVVWEADPVDVSADEAVAAAAGGGGNGNKEQGPSARVFLEAILANGPMPVKRVEEHATTQGISERQLRRAREKLDVWTKKDGFGPGSQQLWGLPGQEVPGQEKIPF